MLNRNLKENKRFNNITNKQDQGMKLSLPSVLHESQDSNDVDFEMTGFLKPARCYNCKSHFCEV